ncbi:MAG: DNA repair protein RadC [Gammaproteobacteria bacterium]
MSIKFLPKLERPREKLLIKGASYLSDAELIALFIRTGIKNHSALSIAHSCLKKFGSLRKFLEADCKTFSEIPGLGSTKYAEMHAVLEMSRRYHAEKILHHDILKNHLEIKSFFSARLEHYQHEVFACLFLDCKNHFLAFEEIAHGTVNYTYVYTRELIKKTLKHNAVKIILAHNHPSGNSMPSEADKQITRNLKNLLDQIDVFLLDHFIIGHGEITSFTEHGWL